jgi:hypothetical protein
MTKKNESSENDKAMQYEPVLYPVFNDDLDEYEEDEKEPDGYECMCCGNIQGKSNGFRCYKCSGPLKDWYS